MMPLTATENKESSTGSGEGGWLVCSGGRVMNLT